MRGVALLPPLLAAACLGGRVHVDEWTDIAIEQHVDVWTQGQHWRLHGVTVLLDSITGISSDLTLSCDSCRVGFPRSRIDSVVTRRTSGLVEGAFVQVAAMSYLRLQMFLVFLIP